MNLAQLPMAVTAPNVGVVTHRTGRHHAPLHLPPRRPRRPPPRALPPPPPPRPAEDGSLVAEEPGPRPRGHRPPGRRLPPQRPALPRRVRPRGPGATPALALEGPS